MEIEGNKCRSVRLLPRFWFHSQTESRSRAVYKLFIGDRKYLTIKLGQQCLFVTCFIFCYEYSFEAEKGGGGWAGRGCNPYISSDVHYLSDLFFLWYIGTFISLWKLSTPLSSTINYTVKITLESSCPQTAENFQVAWTF